MEEFDHHEISEGVVVFKNVLKDPQHVWSVLKNSQKEKHELFTEWMDWGITGFKTTMDPYDKRDLNNEPGQIILELKSIFAKCFSTYKSKYVDKRYMDTLELGTKYDIPITEEERNLAGGWGSADILIIDYANSEGNDGYINGYHTDRTPFWGASTHAFTLNVYPNDNFDGGGLYFVNMYTQEKKITDNGIEYYEIDEPIYYEPKAGEALLFPSNQYHGVSQVYNGEKLFIRMFMESPMPDSWHEESKNMTEEEIDKKRNESRQQVFKEYSHQAGIWNSVDDIKNSGTENKSKRFLIRNKVVN